MSAAPVAPFAARSFLSRMALRRKPSAIRALMPFLSRPGMTSFAGGFPNVATFPFATVHVTLHSGQSVALTEQELAASLQYGPSIGMPALHTELRSLMTREHRAQAARGDWSICVGTGSQDVLDKAFFAVLNEEDAILLESPCYPGTLSSLNGVGCRKVPVTSDADGLQTTELERILATWAGPERRPRVLYTVPTGGNPTGATLSLERRHELLRIAKKYDLLVFEDDAYFYLQFGERIPSLWSLDTDGRVLRFDSLSKIMSAGLRLGWVTGHPELIEQIEFAMQAAALQASSLTQMLVAATLRQWGESGWVAHVAATSAFYKTRRDLMVGLFEKHLSGLCRWSVPHAGMFCWVEVVGVDDAAALMPLLIERNVLCVPGTAFSSTGAKSPFFRFTYSVATPEQMDAGIQRFAAVLRERQSK